MEGETIPQEETEQQDAKVEKIRAILEESCGKMPDGSGLYDWQIQGVAREIVSALDEKTPSTA